MSFHPARRFLFVPAWLWLLPPLCLILLVRSMGPPTHVPEPPRGPELFREPLLFTEDGDSYRFVNLADSKGISPLWALTHTTTAQTHISRSVGFSPATENHPNPHFDLGFYQLSGRWTYSLSAQRFGETHPADKNGWFLPETELEKVRPLAVAELNRRYPNERRGDELERLLTQGAAWNGWLCKENIVILLMGLSVPLSLAAIASMFVRPRKLDRRSR